MAVLPMQRISIYALKKDRKKVLETLQRRGVVEIMNAKIDDALFQKMDTASAQELFHKNKSVAQQAVGILDEYAPRKKGVFSKLNGREEISLKKYEQEMQRAEEIMKTAYRLLSLEREITEQKSEIQRLRTQMEALKPWNPLDISMRFQGTAKTAAFVGAFPEPYEYDELQDKLSKALPDITGFYLEVVATQPEQTCVFLLCLKQDAHKMEDKIRAMGFVRPAAPAKRPPAQQAEWYQAQELQAKQTLEKAREEILAEVEKRDELCFAVDYYAMREEKYRIISRLAQSKHLFIAQGYIPQTAAPALAKELEGLCSSVVECTAPKEDEDVPVALHNNGFAAPVESVVESFSLPGKGEIDPSGIMAGFYYVLFGLMLSDAGYGFLMALACGIALTVFKNMEIGLRKALNMFFFCGLSTIFWGVMFGSYFGDVVTVVSTTFFHNPVNVPALWFVPVNEPMRLLLYSFIIGILHLFTGLGIQGYQLWKAKRYKDAVYDVGFWFLLLISLVVFALCSDMVPKILQIPFVLPEPAGTISGAGAICGAVGIILTSGRESRNPFKRLMKGLYGLYNVTGYLSDVLSYSRLLALGLATGVIASVVNQMAAMTGNIVVFVIIFLVGHTLNIAINLLGAYVHANRLQYVEFFGKFYEGGGRKFQPFSAKTQYFKIKEK